MKYKTGNIVEATEDFIMHGCNCQGVMGSGVAKALRAAYPTVFEVYRKDYETHQGLALGQYSYTTESNKTIVNLYTQRFYGRDGKQYAQIGAIRNSIELFLNSYAPFPKEIATPKIGCGLGGLDWETEVQPLLEDIENRFSNRVEFIVYDL